MGGRLSVLRATLDHARRKILIGYRAVLFHDMEPCLDDSAARILPAEARLDHLAFSVDGVALKHGTFDIELQAQHGKPRVLQRRLRYQSFTEAVAQSGGSETPPERGLL